jgi:predicted  nucleic acid-binding Zn-ribbon protein
MPTCKKCGAYYSEVSCPFCTPDDSPESPVTTINVEESKPIRIIDPLDLIESVEKANEELENLGVEKEKEIRNLNEKITNRKKIEEELQKELDDINNQVSQIEDTFKNQKEKQKQLIAEKENIQQELKDLKMNLAKIEENIANKEAEVAELKTMLGVW